MKVISYSFLCNDCGTMNCDTHTLSFDMVGRNKNIVIVSANGKEEEKTFVCDNDDFYHFFCNAYKILCMKLGVKPLPIENEPYYDYLNDIFD